MNNTKQAYNAGQATRAVVNDAARTAKDKAQTVSTTVSGFLRGFFADPAAPVPAKRTAKRKVTK